MVATPGGTRGEIPHIHLLSVVFLAVACALLATGALAVDPPASGDWVIDDVTTASGTDIVVTGNVTVARGGSLSLSDLSLLINVSEDGAYNIDVQPGGTLTMTGVTVDSLDRTTLFNLTISGSATLGQCTIRRMDGPEVPNPLAEPQGLVVLSSSVLIHNTTIENCGGFAVTVQPGGLVDVTPVIQDCDFLGNGGGLYCGGLLVAGGNAWVVDCTFSSNSVGDVVVLAADPIISGCSFVGSIISPTIAGVVAIGFAEPTIVDCDFSWTLSAINSILASPTVRDCTISWSAVGVNVLGNAPVFDSVSISTTINPMILNATFAEVTDCTITSFLTPGYAVAIDSGGPVISRLSVDLTLLGGAISIINGSRTTISDSVLSGSGAAHVVYVEDAEPILDGCTIVGGTHGVELFWSRATLKGCAIQENSEWGIVSWFDTFTMNDVTFGSGGQVNGEGRVLQFYGLTVHVEHADGSPAIDATVLVHNALDEKVEETATNAEGLAFSSVFASYEITNGNRTIRYTPHLLDASLGELVNVSSVDITGNPEVVLVLRPFAGTAPVVEITSPGDGATYNAWDHRDGIPLVGTAVDPDGGPVVMGWTVDGVDIEGEPGNQFLDPGEHSVGLRAMDQTGLETWVNVTFTIVSVPPEEFGITIERPLDGNVYDPGEDVTVRAYHTIEEHPYLDIDAVPNITWTSSRDGPLPVEGARGVLTGLTFGEHIITVVLTPLFPEWLPDPYTDSVTIQMLAQAPVAVANISSPSDGAVFLEGDPVLLSAEGSSFDIWDPPEYRAVFRWSSDLDGLLGEGRELEARYLSVGVHIITLELTTDPFIVSDNATVTITIEAPPNSAPEARITLLTSEPVAGKPVLLSGAGSVDPDGDVLTYHWDLGDGNTSDIMEVNHTYAKEGNYTVVLTVSDGQAEDSSQLVVEVVPYDDGGNGGGNGNGNGDDGGPVEPVEDGIWGWVLLALLLLAILGMLFMAWRGRPDQD
jgi:hypothetical protein